MTAKDKNDLRKLLKMMIEILSKEGEVLGNNVGLNKVAKKPTRKERVNQTINEL